MPRNFEARHLEASAIAVASGGGHWGNGELYPNEYTISIPLICVEIMRNDATTERLSGSPHVADFLRAQCHRGAKASTQRPARAMRAMPVVASPAMVAMPPTTATRAAMMSRSWLRHQRSRGPHRIRNGGQTSRANSQLLGATAPSIQPG
eukprot:s371_g20.t1